ncbi:MAG TPA: cupin domain-containing protein, partial [Patescibacteria group bacterium]|nr:cupin domain-containing protein [Patescibacteria group bacterium]
NFRKVIYTGPHAQLVLMSLLPGEEIGEEVHKTTDQVLFFVAGDEEVEAVINDKPFWVEEHGVVFVPAGTKHNFINKGSEDLKLYTLYAPPAHKDGTIHETKNDAEKEEEYE